MYHSFNEKIAELVGIGGAVIYNHISFWIKKNEIDNRNYHDGKYWTYNTHKEYMLVFPYLSEQQIKYALNKLVEKNLLIKGNYNKERRDRTTWYAIGELGEHINSLMQKLILTNDEELILTIGKDNFNYSTIADNKHTDSNYIYKKQKTKTSFTPPTIEEVEAYCFERANGIDPEQFISYYQSIGWKIGRNTMKDWKSAVITWEKKNKETKKSETIKHNHADYIAGL